MIPKGGLADRSHRRQTFFSALAYSVIFGREKDILGSLRNIDGGMRAERFGDRQKGGTPS
jgi:hypothetical protein